MSFDPDKVDLERALDDMTEGLAACLRERDIEAPLIAGIYTGGVWVAERLHAALALDDPLSTLDISFYRDDFTRIGINPQVRPSRLPVNIDDRHVVLVDDVMHTGRTVRAALNVLFDYGRPASVILAALIDRGGRELPMQADVIGQRLPLRANEQVKLSGPDPLNFTVQRDGD